MNIKKSFVIISFLKRNRFVLSCFALIATISISIMIVSKYSIPKKIKDPNIGTQIPASYHPPVQKKAQLAIIIDDFGQNRKGVSEILQIKKPLTFAIMPFLDFTRKDALMAHQLGQEVIIHLPMQSAKHDIAAWIGPNPIKVSYKYDKIQEIILSSLKSVPFAVGANIHMGSLCSENKYIMSSVIKVLKENNMYFVDSRTSSLSVCKRVAKNTGIRFDERNVFLEAESKSEWYIKKQLRLAGSIAIKKGHAIAIGHVGSAGGRVTAICINDMIPQLEKQGIKLVYVSDLFK
jgi:uncharacterized protein